MLLVLTVTLHLTLSARCWICAEQADGGCPEGDGVGLFFQLRSTVHRNACAACRVEQRNSQTLSTRLTLSSPSRKNIPISIYPKSCFTSSIPSHRGDASRSSRTSGAGCGGRVGSQHDCHADERSDATVKSRGSGIPVLMPSWRMTNSPATGATQPVPGKSAYKPQNYRAGKVGMSGRTCGSAACIFSRRRAMGEASSRPSLRPHFSEGDEFLGKLGRNPSRERKRM